MQGILHGTLGEEFHIDYMNDSMFKNSDNPMSIIRDFEKSGIGSVVRDKELLDALAEVEILIVHWSAVTPEMMDAAPKLKFVGSMRSGLENIDMKYAAKKGITVRNCPGRLGDSVADLTLALILDANKGLMTRNLVLTKGEWVDHKPYQKTINRPLRLLTAGIVGFGAIGQKVAKRLQAFGTKVQAYDPYTADAAFEQMGVKRVDLDTLMATSDIITIHARLVEETKGMIGKHEMSLIKDGCMFINTARADLVDEEAFMESMKSGKIAAAGLDVYWQEPFDKNCELLTMNNVTMMPHIGGVFPGVAQLSMGMLMESLAEYLNG